MLTVIPVFGFVMSLETLEIQGDQINMAMFFGYLGKSDLSSVHLYNGITLTGYFYKVPER